MVHAGGRPLKFASVEELQKKVDAYFADCDPHAEEVKEWVEARDEKGNLQKDKHGLNYLVEVTHMIKTKQRHYTITGLAVALETSRETLLDYESGKYDDPNKTEDEKKQFSDTVKAAKVKIESYVESKLFESNATGPIFNLKNNYGWKDKSEVDGEQQITIVTRKGSKQQ